MSLASRQDSRIHNLYRDVTAVFTHLCHLFLESKCELGASIHEGSCSVGHVLEPLDDEGCCNAKWEIPYDVKVGGICGAAHTLTHILVTNMCIHSDHNHSLYHLIFSPSSHGFEIFTGNPRSIL